MQRDASRLYPACSMTDVHITGLTKCFGQTTAVDKVDLHIKSGELFFLLGPSGCGKTTLLRMIAGFIDPSEGSIHFGDRDVTHLPANKRQTGMVFQSYALWPHMTVHENVAYGLKVRKIPKESRQGLVKKALTSVQMEQYAQRKPNQLSGGQQQRVALARALVVEPTVLLLDEPLSNLDARLRLEMRGEIRRICRESGITTIYVTHDQVEALSMADRMVVLKDGKAKQIGPPEGIYRRPCSQFVAEFLGEANFLSATLGPVGNRYLSVQTAAGTLKSACPLVQPSGSPQEGQSVICCIRPEALQALDDSTDASTRECPENILEGQRAETMYLGETAQHLVVLSDGSRLKVLELNPSGPHGHRSEGVDGPAQETARRERLYIHPDDVILVPCE